MKTKLLATTLLGLLVGPFTANAIPIKYDVTFSGSVGPNGVGSFFYDDSTQLMTNFNWAFANETGGLSDNLLSADPFGYTFGSFVFEMLSQTDANLLSIAYCRRHACS